jgi:hypothetical protein
LALTTIRRVAGYSAPESSFSAGSSWICRAEQVLSDPVDRHGKRRVVEQLVLALPQDPLLVDQ